jgi:hypothetical protein
MVIARAMIAGSLAVGSGGLARAADAVEVQVAVRVGYAFGQGLTIGPALSAGWTSSWLAVPDAGVFIGAVAGADLTLGAPRGPVVRLHVAPEVTGILVCPVIQVPLAAGPVWSFGDTEGWDFGWQITSGIATDPSKPRPRYGNRAAEPQLFTGVFYRYARLAASGGQHAAGAELRFLALPFDGQSEGLGYCGGD